MADSIKNVTVVGASGNLGSIILQELLASRLFNIQVLQRNSSSSTFEREINVVKADFDSFKSLENALLGQDAIVVALSTTAVASQKLLIDAAISAGVQRFIPSEFGSDLSNPLTRKLPALAEKTKIRDYLMEKSSTTSLSYTIISNGPFLDWGLRYKFLLDCSTYKPTIFNSGDTIFSTTSLETIGHAVVAILKESQETKNRVIYIEDIKITQNKLLKLAKEVAPGKPWKIQNIDLDAIIKQSDTKLEQGILDYDGFISYIYLSFLDPKYGGAFKRVDNELLGIKGKTEKDITELLKKIIE